MCVCVCVCVCVLGGDMEVEVEKYFCILIGWMNKASDVYCAMGFNSFYG